MLKKEAHTDFISSVVLYIFRFNLLTFKRFNCTIEQCSLNNATKLLHTIFTTKSKFTSLKEL